MPYMAQAQLMGHLGGPVEMKTTNSGRAYSKGRIAVSTGWGDSKTTTWWTVTVFGPQAEWFARDGEKGSLVVAAGEVEVRTFEKNDGTSGWSAELLAREVRVIGGKRDADNAKADERAPAAPAGGGMPDDEPPFMPVDYI